jgi:hypothetical protein
VSLISRCLEAAGIATVIIGSALDIVEHCGVPRFVFADLPLGNPCGVPYDETMHRSIVDVALDTLESADAPRTTVATPHVWPEESWKAGYMSVRPEEAAELAAKGRERRAMLAQRKQDDTKR